MEYTFKGTCWNTDELNKLSSTANIGDLYIICDDCYCWDGKDWLKTEYHENEIKNIECVKCCASCMFCKKKVDTELFDSDHRYETFYNTDVEGHCLLHGTHVELFTNICDNYR